MSLDILTGAAYWLLAVVIAVRTARSVAAAPGNPTATAGRLRWTVLDVVCTAFIATAAVAFFAGQLWLAGSGATGAALAMGARIVVVTRVDRRLDQRLAAADA
jgi:hypothetical protein